MFTNSLEVQLVPMPFTFRRQSYLLAIGWATVTRLHAGFNTSQKTWVLVSRLVKLGVYMIPNWIWEQQKN